MSYFNPVTNHPIRSHESFTKLSPVPRRVPKATEEKKVLSVQLVRKDYKEQLDREDHQVSGRWQL